MNSVISKPTRTVNVKTIFERFLHEQGSPEETPGLNNFQVIIIPWRMMNAYQSVPDSYFRSKNYISISFWRKEFVIPYKAFGSVLVAKLNCVITGTIELTLHRQATNRLLHCPPSLASKKAISHKGIPKSPVEKSSPRKPCLLSVIYTPRNTRRCGNSCRRDTKYEGGN